MDVSKTDLDRAKTKSVKVFPAGKSITMVPSFARETEVGGRSQHFCRYSYIRYSLAILRKSEIKASLSELKL